MIFTSWAFACFTLAVLATYWTIVPARFKAPYLAAVGMLFYVYAIPVYAIVIGCLAALTYATAWAMLRVPADRRRPYLLGGTIAVVGALAFFKYANFLETIVAELARTKLAPFPQLLVPLGISFFTFEFVHVLVDVARGDIRKLEPGRFATFAFFFPTLVAGPIKRYEAFAPQLETIVRPPPAVMAAQLYRVVLGLAKKCIVADSMDAFTAPLAAPGPPYERLDYAIAVLAYSVKIYFDFSAYSDIAIGTAGLLGIHIPENFARPYRAADMSDFWRRWHITLSTWVRDYVFIPLGGSRRSGFATAFNLVTAMTIVGLWHGAAWTFVAWGAYHGLGLVIHRIWKTTIVPRVASLRGRSRIRHALYVTSTFSFVALGWVLFAAPSLSAAGRVLRGLLF